MSDYSSNFPQQRPKLNLVFNSGSDKLDSRLSYSRSSTGTYLSNEKHLSSLNLVTNSEDFSAWSPSNVTASANTTAAPDGNTTASTMTGNAGTAEKRVQSNSVAVTDPVISVYAKAGTHNYIQISDNQSSQEYGNFDLANGTVGNVGTLATAAIQAVGSTGWYRCMMRVERTASAFTWRVFMIDSSTAARQSTTSSTGTVHLWGGMMTELGDLTNVVAYQSSGSQIHREFAPTLKTAAADEPRFEYAADGQSEGLLIEAQATNYITNSELDAGYSALRLTTSAGACVGPTGALAQVFTETTDDGTRYIAHAFANNLDYSTTYTASVFAKKVASGTTDSRIKLRINGMGGDAYAGFDLVNGTVTQQAGPAIDSATISSVGNGCYRISMTWTNEAADRATGIIVAFNDNTASSLASYVGDGFTSYALAGLMVEEGSAASSLISTSGAAATRSADSCSVATSSFYTGGPVTMVGEVSGSGSGYSAMAELRDTASKAAGKNDYLMVSKNNASDTDASSFKLFAYDNSTSQAAFTISGSGGATTIAARLDTNNVGACADGGAVTTDTSAVIPDSLDTLYIGRGYSGYELGSTIKRLALYNVALSDLELQSLTSS